jgi:type IV pilus assembly protein PilB
MAFDRYGRTKKLLGQILKEMKLVHEGMVQEALATQRKEGGQIGRILVRLGHLTEAQLTAALARQAGFETVDLATVRFTPELLEAVDPGTARIFGVVPVSRADGRLTVALANPQS